MRCTRCSIEIQSYTTFTISLVTTDGHTASGTYCAGCLIAMIGATNLSRITNSIRRVSQLELPRP